MKAQLKAYSRGSKQKMKTKNKVKSIVFTSVSILSLVLALIPNGQFAFAESISSLQKKAQDLQAKIEANTKQAEELAHEASTLEGAIAALDKRLAAANDKIALTTVKVEKLSEELKQTQKELERQKGLLTANMRALYKRGGASPVELLVASDNFSQFIDEQEYLERLKAGIQDSAEKVIELKLKIQKQHDEQEQLLKEQKAAREELEELRQSRARLLAKTRGSEARYRSIVADLRKQQRQAEAALAAALGTGNYKVAPIGPVGRGDVIGRVGSTGLSSGPHLHLEVRIGGSVTNPAPYIKHQPVIPTHINQSFGNPDPIYMSGYHPGIDFAPGGGAIYAIDSGYLYRGCSNQLLGTSNNAYGYVALVDHGGGRVSVYAHMSGGPAACNYNTYYR